MNKIHLIEQKKRLRATKKQKQTKMMLLMLIIIIMNMRVYWENEIALTICLIAKMLIERIKFEQVSQWLLFIKSNTHTHMHKHSDTRLTSRQTYKTDGLIEYIHICGVQCNTFLISVFSLRNNKHNNNNKMLFIVVFVLFHIQLGDCSNRVIQTACNGSKRMSHSTH